MYWGVRWLGVGTRDEEGMGLRKCVGEGLKKEVYVAGGMGYTIQIRVRVCVRVCFVLLLVAQQERIMVDLLRVSVRIGMLMMSGRWQREGFLWL